MKAVDLEEAAEEPSRKQPCHKTEGRIINLDGKSDSLGPEKNAESCPQPNHGLDINVQNSKKQCQGLNEKQSVEIGTQAQAKGCVAIGESGAVEEHSSIVRIQTTSQQRQHTPLPVEKPRVVIPSISNSTIPCQVSIGDVVTTTGSDNQVKIQIRIIKQDKPTTLVQRCAATTGGSNSSLLNTPTTAVKLVDIKTPRLIATSALANKTTTANQVLHNISSQSEQDSTSCVKVI